MKAFLFFHFILKFIVCLLEKTTSFEKHIFLLKIEIWYAKKYYGDIKMLTCFFIFVKYNT
jgi:hypothetical protein